VQISYYFVGVVYMLTEKGEQNTKVIVNANEEIQNFLKNMSLLKD